MNVVDALAVLSAATLESGAEHVVLSHCAIPTGWRFVKIAKPQSGEWYISDSGKPVNCIITFNNQARVIVERAPVKVAAYMPLVDANNCQVVRVPCLGEFFMDGAGNIFKANKYAGYTTARPIYEQVMVEIG